MIWVYSLFSISLLGLYFLGRLRISKKNRVGTNINPKQISVVVPYRNEAENLPKLLSCIGQMKSLTLEIIFVNDHSTDDGAALLPEKINETPVFSIHLTTETSGKKAAIRAGVERASGDYILTWDADITISSCYFEAISELEEADLLILPVSMRGTSWYASFFELDYAYLPNLQTALAGFDRYFVCSGANLLFSKTAYLNFNKAEWDAKSVSGDDIFLLRGMKLNGQKIGIATSKKLLAETALPSSFSAVLHQRLRWIGKTNAVGDKLSGIIGILGIIYHFTPWILLIFCPFSIYLIGAKALIDSFLFFPYLRAQGNLNRLWFVPFFSLIYPFYMLFVLFLLPWFKPKWKGRWV